MAQIFGFELVILNALNQTARVGDPINPTCGQLLKSEPNGSDDLLALKTACGVS